MMNTNESDGSGPNIEAVSGQTMGDLTGDQPTPGNNIDRSNNRRRCKGSYLMGIWACVVAILIGIIIFIVVYFTSSTSSSSTGVISGSNQQSDLSSSSVIPTEAPSSLSAVTTVSPSSTSGTIDNPVLSDAPTPAASDFLFTEHPTESDFVFRIPDNKNTIAPLSPSSFQALAFREGSEQLQQVSECQSPCRELVDLPIRVGNEIFDSFYVWSNGRIELERLDGVLATGDRPYYINAAHLFALKSSLGNGVWMKRVLEDTDGTSVEVSAVIRNQFSTVISWEGLTLDGTNLTASAQSTLHSNGTVHLCWGSMDSAVNQLTHGLRMGIQDFGRRVLFPATGEPFFDNQGIVPPGSPWPSNLCQSFHLALPPFLPEWVLLGSKIKPSSSAGIGTSVALSADGTVMAVGVPFDGPGHVVVYRLVNSDWEQMGNVITDVGCNWEYCQEFGSSVDLSGDGLVITASSGFTVGSTSSDVLGGRAQIFEYDENLADWKARGIQNAAIAGFACKSLGWSVALSGDGNRWVIGVPDTGGSGHFLCQSSDVLVVQKGKILVYEYDDLSQTWSKLGGESLPTGLEGENLGLSVAISRDGQRVASTLLHRQNGGGRLAMGRVFQLNDEGNWMQLGQDLVMEIEEYYTKSISLDATGMRVAMVSKRLETGTAFVRVFQWTGTQWSQRGQDIEDEDQCCSFFTFENSVALSDDGDRLIFGNSGHGEDVNFRGIARVYEWNESTNLWGRLGQAIEGEHVDGELWFGYSTAISADGSRISAGAPSGNSDFAQTYELR